MKKVLFAIIISVGLNTAAYAYELPDATAKTLIFSDQLNDAPGTANFKFNANHYIGTQKVDHERIVAYKGINPKFIVLQYHKSYGTDLQQNITSPASPAWNNDCDTFYSWVSSHPTYGSIESYYLHCGAAIDSAHRIKHFWNNTNEYFLADPRHDGWRRYVAEVNVWRCQNIGFDGTFFDATYFPSYGYEPANWFDSIPYSAGGITNFGAPWNASFATPYWAFIRNYFHASGRGCLCIVNCDQMVTGWYNDDYLDSVDGAMTEGFFTYSGKLTGSDWQLSAGRILKYLTGGGKNKVLIAQCSPDAANLSVRRWCIANYLLLKNKYSYYNIASGSTASWWPEYDIALDSFVMQPAALADLLVPGSTSLYKREYKNGLVLVNPGSVAQSFTLTRQLKPLTFNGGGAVTNGVAPSMSLTPGATVFGAVSVAPGEVLILQSEGAAIAPEPKRTASVSSGHGFATAYTITGKKIGVSAHKGSLHASLRAMRGACGIYIFRCSSNGIGRRLTVDFLD